MRLLGAATVCALFDSLWSLGSFASLWVKNEHIGGHCESIADTTPIKTATNNVKHGKMCLNVRRLDLDRTLLKHSAKLSESFIADGKTQLLAVSIISTTDFLEHLLTDSSGYF